MTKRQYHIEKEKWPPGPWHDEPDELEFEYEGLKCRMGRGPFGSWCGYVGVPEGHPAFGCSYDPPWEWYELNENQQWWRQHVSDVTQCAITDIVVHGGLTYANRQEDGLWWFGFDCAHGLDLCPGLRSDTLYGRLADGGSQYRDLNYAMANTKSLATQLAHIKRRGKIHEKASGGASD